MNKTTRLAFLIGLGLFLGCAAHRPQPVALSGVSGMACSWRALVTDVIQHQEGESAEDKVDRVYLAASRAIYCDPRSPLGVHYLLWAADLATVRCGDSGTCGETERGILSALNALAIAVSSGWTEFPVTLGDVLESHRRLDHICPSFPVVQ